MNRATVILGMSFALAFGASPAAAQCSDLDGDGFFYEAGCGTARDCNDTAPTTYPGASELCDGYDNDCDSLVDNQPSCNRICDMPGLVGEGTSLLESSYGDPITPNTLVWTGAHFSVLAQNLPGLRLERFNAEGNFISVSTPITTMNVDDDPSLIWNGLQYGVFWSSSREIYFARLDSNGNRLGFEKRLTNDPAFSRQPRAVWTGQHYGVVWKDDRIQPEDEQTFFLRVDALGNKIQTEVRLSEVGSNIFTPPLIGWSGDEYLVIWPSEVGTQRIRLAEDGSPVSPILPSAGGHHLLWNGTEYGLWGDGGNFRRLDPAGNVIASIGAAIAGNGVWTGSEYGLVNGSEFIHIDPVAGVADTRELLEPLGYSVAWNGSTYASVGDLFRIIACDCPDLDGDNATSCSDCDDSDSAVFPGALQLCDGKNNDCRSTWPDIPLDEVDVDEDGFAVCEQDCNDGAATVYPDAPQLCDGLNNDCNSLFYPNLPPGELDEDSDSYPLCANDCDDTNSSIYPQAPQLCDELNNDCNDPNWPTVPPDEEGGDVDLDGICGGSDNCPADFNPGQEDVDSDGFGNPCDPDDDNDAILDDGDVSGDIGDGPCIGGVILDCDDNCQFVANADQADGNGDGVGTACESSCDLVVGPQPGTDFVTISEALPATTDGCRVLVKPGTYGDPLVLDRFVTIEAEGTPVDTIIDLGGVGTGITVPDRSVPGDITVRGFSIRNATHGIQADESLRLDNCVIANIAGTAIDLGLGSHTVRNTTISPCGCQTGVSLAEFANLTMDNVRISGVGSTALQVAGNAVVRNLIAAQNAGTGVLVVATGSMDLSFATISDNNTGLDAISSALIVDHSVIYGNVTDILGSSCDAFTYSDTGVDCTAAGGNITAPPQFVAPGTGDYQLSVSSPAIDAGMPVDAFAGVPCQDINDEPRVVDGDGDGQVRADMGAFEFVNAAAQASEIQNLMFDEERTMTWENAAPRYNIYRGLLSELSYGTVGECFVSGLFSTEFNDPDDPLDGDGFFYLVTGESANEGMLGRGSCSQRMSSVPCP